MKYSVIMQNVISFLVIGVYLSVGYFIFYHGKELNSVQSDLIKDWVWYAGLAFLLVIFTWFPSAIPFLKDIIGSLVSLRTGRQETTPLPTPYPIQTPAQPITAPIQMPHTLPPSYPIQMPTFSPAEASTFVFPTEPLRL